jgi:hypothetical protein
MGLRPFESIYPQGVWGVNHSNDPFYPQRAALILLGLASTVVALGELIWACSSKPTDMVRLGAFVAMFVTCAVVGWRSYPFWATGVYQVYKGAMPPVDLDPKALIPMSWVGEFWRFPVLLLELLCFAAIPLLTVCAAIGFWRGRLFPAIVTALGIAVTLIFWVGFSPNFNGWLMD